MGLEGQGWVWEKQKCNFFIFSLDFHLTETNVLHMYTLFHLRVSSLFTVTDDMPIMLYWKEVDISVYNWKMLHYLAFHGSSLIWGTALPGIFNCSFFSYFQYKLLLHVHYPIFCHSLLSCFCLLIHVGQIISLVCSWWCLDIYFFSDSWQIIPKLSMRAEKFSYSVQYWDLAQ